MPERIPGAVVTPCFSHARRSADQRSRFYAGRIRRRQRWRGHDERAFVETPFQFRSGIGRQSRSRSTAAASPWSGSCRRALNFRSRSSASRAAPSPSASISGSRSLSARLSWNRAVAQLRRHRAAETGCLASRRRRPRSTPSSRDWHKLFPDNYAPRPRNSAPPFTRFTNRSSVECEPRS